MMTRRGVEVETATAQMQVIGRRHFGRKAVPAGGGGGRQATRELFDTLLLWKARVALDDAGDATVEVPLNDSLTGFRIVAVASAGAGFFGTGEASIRSTQDLMLQAGLPPLVRDGDRFRAGVTVRNASPQAQAVTVAAQFAAGAGRAGPMLPAQDVALAAGEARELGWDVAVPGERRAPRLAVHGDRPGRGRGAGARRAEGRAEGDRRGAGAHAAGDTAAARRAARPRRGAPGRRAARPRRHRRPDAGESSAATCPACATISDATPTPASSSGPRRRSASPTGSAGTR